MDFKLAFLLALGWSEGEMVERRSEGECMMRLEEGGGGGGGGGRGGGGCGRSFSWGGEGQVNEKAIEEGGGGGGIEEMGERRSGGGGGGGERGERVDAGRVPVPKARRARKAGER